MFDAKAAASVMAAYQAQGNRVMIDLMHGATDDEAIRLRSDAADAMCWFDLEVLNGELWGVNAEWTPEGERRVRAKLQRYLSPAFLHDKSNRIVELANVALVSRAGLCQATDVAALRARDQRPRKVALSASFDAVRTAIDAAVRALVPASGMGCEPYVCDVFQDTAVYEFNGLFWQVSYTFQSDKAAIKGPPVQVERQYVPVPQVAAQLRSAIVSALSGRRMKSK